MNAVIGHAVFIDCIRLYLDNNNKAKYVVVVEKN